MFSVLMISLTDKPLTSFGPQENQKNFLDFEGTGQEEAKLNFLYIELVIQIGLGCLYQIRATDVLASDKDLVQWNLLSSPPGEMAKYNNKYIKIIKMQFKYNQSSSDAEKTCNLILETSIFCNLMICKNKQGNQLLNLVCCIICSCIKK